MILGFGGCNVWHCLISLGPIPIRAFFHTTSFLLYFFFVVVVGSSRRRITKKKKRNKKKMIKRRREEKKCITPKVYVLGLIVVGQMKVFIIKRT